MTTTETASAYWKRQRAYPFPFTRKRRIYELNYLLPRLEQVKGRRLLDLGCGDGSLLECLLRLTDYEVFHGYDISEGLMTGIDPRVRTKLYDLTAPGDLPDVDATIIAGVIQYIFDDDTVRKVLEKVTSDIVWIRSTCTLKPERESIERNGYASLYRTLPETIRLLSGPFVVSAVDRVYPDAVESQFGTKQFYFEVRRSG